MITVFVNDNQDVAAGTTLFQIDPTDYKVAVDQAAGELADAQSAARAAQSSVPVTSIGATANISYRRPPLVFAKHRLAWLWRRRESPRRKPE